VYCIVVPSAPMDVHAELSHSSQNTAHTVDVTLRWKPPAHVNGIIRSYEISLSTNSNLPDHLWTSIISNGTIVSVSS